MSLEDETLLIYDMDLKKFLTFDFESDDPEEQ